MKNDYVRGAPDPNSGGYGGGYGYSGSNYGYGGSNYGYGGYGGAVSYTHLTLPTKA